jgi:hypothetical protein
LENLKGRGHMGDLGVDKMIILKCEPVDWRAYSPIQRVPGVKRPERQAGHSWSSISEVTGYIFMAWYLVKAQGQIYVYLINTVKM